MTKIISISDEAYDKLKRIKGGRSFTKVVLDLTGPKKRSILDYAGIWKDDEEMGRILDEILRERNKIIERDVAKW